LSRKDWVEAILGFIAGYVGWQFLDYVKALLGAMLASGFSASLPYRTVILGIVGVGVICVAAILLALPLLPKLKAFLLPPVLTAELFGEPDNRFLVGGTLCFKAQYRGNLTNGFFTSKVRPEELDIILDTGKDHEWLVDYNTNIPVTNLTTGEHYDTGSLNGPGSGWIRKSHRSMWGHKIAFRYPPGKYSVTVMLYQEKEHQSVLVGTVKDLHFTVLEEEKLMPLRGWDKDGNLIPPPRSMFVRKPRKRNWFGRLK